MRWRIPLVLILALFVAVSCDQQPTDPVEQPVSAAPELNFINGPESPGVVFRGTGDLVWVDIIENTPQDESWVVFFGTRFGNQMWPCGGPRFYQTAWQDVGTDMELLMDKDYPLVAYRHAEFLPLYMEGMALGENPHCYAASRAEQIAGGQTRVQAHATPDFAYLRTLVNGTVTWEGETYRIHYKMDSVPGGYTANGRIW